MSKKKQSTEGEPNDSKKEKIKGKIIRVRVSESEKKIFDAKAKAADMSLSMLIRKSLTRANIVSRSDEKRKLMELRRIGSNLHQIAIQVNENLNSLDAVNVIARLASLEREVRRLAEGGESSSDTT